MVWFSIGIHHSGTTCLPEEAPYVNEKTATPCSQAPPPSRIATVDYAHWCGSAERTRKAESLRDACPRQMQEQLQVHIRADWPCFGVHKQAPYLMYLTRFRRRSRHQHSPEKTVINRAPNGKRQGAARSRAVVIVMLQRSALIILSFYYMC
jgi:hypothetical protein